MTTENLPQVHSNLMPSAQEFQMLQVIAKNAQDSGLYAGVGQQAKIFMVMLAARELGISPMLALNGGIWNIQGKIEISARLMNGLIRRAGHSIKEIVSNDKECRLLGKRNDGDSFETCFTIEDAMKAGLAGGNVWKKYPADMLYNRCMSRLARRLFPDVIGTAYCEGEVREAKEVERLEQAECEIKHHSFQPLALNPPNKPDIPYIKEPNNASPSNIDTNLEHIQVDTNLNEKISKDQLDQMLTLYSATDDQFKENYEKYMKQKWNASEYHDLPLRAYQPTMTAIQRNLELNQQKGGLSEAV